MSQYYEAGRGQALFHRVDRVDHRVGRVLNPIPLTFRVDIHAGALAAILGNGAGIPIARRRSEAPEIRIFDGGSALAVCYSIRSATDGSVRIARRPGK